MRKMFNPGLELPGDDILVMTPLKHILTNTFRDSKHHIR